MNGRGGHRDNRQLSAYQQLAMVSRPQGQGHELGRRPAPAGGRQVIYLNTSIIILNSLPRILYF